MGRRGCRRCSAGIAGYCAVAERARHASVDPLGEAVSHCRLQIVLHWPPSSHSLSVRSCSEIRSVGHSLSGSVSPRHRADTVCAASLGRAASSTLAVHASLRTRPHTPLAHAGCPSTGAIGERVSSSCRCIRSSNRICRADIHTRAVDACVARLTGPAPYPRTCPPSHVSAANSTLSCARRGDAHCSSGIRLAVSCAVAHAVALAERRRLVGTLVLGVRPRRNRRARAARDARRRELAALADVAARRVAAHAVGRADRADAFA